MQDTNKALKQATKSPFLFVYGSRWKPETYRISLPTKPDQAHMVLQNNYSDINHTLYSDIILPTLQWNFIFI